jgi:hypothetical protein
VYRKAISGHETGLNAAAATENATATAMKKTDESSQLSERSIDYVETMPFDEDFKGEPAALPTLDTEGMFTASSFSNQGPRGLTKVRSHDDRRRGE